MKQTTRPAILVTLTVLGLTALTALVARAPAAGPQTLEDKVREFQLRNGMRFLVVERPVAPVFFAAIAFDVGSINEIEGKTGISHFLEHMMFKGTKKIGTKSYDRERKYLEEEDRLAASIAARRREIGAWRLAIFDDFARTLVSSLPEDVKESIGSDRAKETEALVAMLETRQEVPGEAARYPALLEDGGTDYFGKYIDSKKQQIKLRQVQDRHKELIIEEEFWDIYQTEGGRMLNAFTANDVTAYIVYLPSNRLELWMAVESDRLKNPVFREAYQERDVVAEELRLGQNDPNEMLWDAFNAAAFQASPYRRPIVGWMSDLESTTRADLEDHFRRYYAPNNAVAILVGDVDAGTVERMARAYFGDIPAQAPIPPLITREPEQKGERRVTVEHESNPRVIIGYHIPAAPHPDYYPIQALIAVLGQGRTSRLYKIYEDLQLTSEPAEVSSGPGDKLDNLLMIQATPRYPHTAREVEDAIYAEIEAIKGRPPTDYELERIRNKTDAEMVRTLGSNMGIAFNLGFHEVIRGDWRSYLTDHEMVKQVTPDQVSYVAGKYLTLENRTVATLVKIEAAGEEGAHGAAEGVDMQAVIDFVKTLPEAEQRRIFARVQTMSPEERKVLLKELAERMKASGKGKEAQGAN
jgi:predicted Zn-dependent peptidase